MRLKYFAALALLTIFQISTAAASPVCWIHLTGTIDPATSDFLEKSLQKDCSALVVELDTPGGLVVSVRSMTEAISRSKIPVIVYVSPAGASATSAGALLTLASHVAAMSPGTNIGAAHPVGQQGEDIKGVMGEKVVSDTAALARSLAELRGRNVETAEMVVKNSKSFTASEAVAARIVEMIAENREDLFKKLEGRKIFMGAAGKEERTLRLVGLPVTELQMSLGQKLLHFLSNPNVSAILMSLGLLLIYVELSHPGITIAGIAGVICLLTAFMAFQLLAVRTGGAVLVVLGIILMCIEPFITTKGILAAGGVISFILGMIWLIDPASSDAVISPQVWIPIAIGLSSGVGLIGYAAARTRRLSQDTLKRVGGSSLSGLAGYEGHVESVSADGLNGKAMFRGEVWSFHSKRPLKVGERVKAKRLNGFEVEIE